MTFHWRPRARRAAVGRPLFDDAVMLLEDRIMLDAVPVVSVTPPEHVLLDNPANNFQVTLTFDNHAGSQPGYGPYIEVIVPKNGADGVAFGPAHADGATFVGATYLGQAVTVAANLTFDAAGHATDPLTKEVVTGTPGDGLVVLQLPFGSFTPPQTTADIVATFAQSPSGTVGTPLTISARGGFQYGLDPLDNPMVDPHIVGATASATYTPTLAVLTKTSDAPANTEEETATGPNNDHYYTLNLDVANGQTLTNATLSDALPDSIVYLGATIVNGTGTIAHQPTIGSVVNPADDLLSVDFASLTGGPGTTDAVVKVHFYVNNVHADGTPVIDPATGAITTTVNTTHLTSTFTPLDPIHPVATFTLDATQPDTIQDKPVAIQKTATIVTDTGPPGLSSGDTVEYKLTVQVSDYFTLGNLSLTDVLTDGQRIDTSFAPTIQLTERGVATPVTAIAGVAVNPLPANGDVTTGHDFVGNFATTFDATTGTTTSIVALSNVVPGGLLAGGRTQPGDGAATGGTTVTITFHAVVQNNFENDALDAAHRAVHQGDAIGNNVTIAASIRDNAAPAVFLGGTATRDDGTASLTIARGGVTKAIYAINGDTNLADFTVGGNVQLVAGDLITYRLTYDLPITSYQALSLTDFLPLPVLAAQSLTLNNAAPFAAGNFAYGPADTLHLTANAPTPIETFDAAGNSVKFAYPDYSIQNQGPVIKDSKIDLLFTVAVQDSPLADGLFLTNLATSSESNTPGNATSGNSIVHFALGQPRLVVQKAIVSATNGTITTPESVAGLTFLAPGVVSGGRGYTLSPATQPLTDTTLGASASAAATKLNSNVSGLDGGDDARVAIVVNNQGSSANGAFDAVLNDTLPAGTSFLGGSLASANLIVTRGDGTIFTAGTDYTVTSTATGLSIHFLDSPSTGKIERNGATDHGDIVLVTYDIHVDNSVVISPTVLSSSATISSFAAVPSGINQVTVPPTDAATITLLQPTVVKTLVSTTDPSTTGGNLTIGEQATYEVTYTLPEGTTQLVRLADLLPATAAAGQYQFVSETIVAVGANLKQGDGTTAADAAYFGPPVIGTQTGAVSATFGGGGKTIVNLADNVADAKDQIVVDYVVQATNAATNVSGLSGVNTGKLFYGGASVSATAPIGITLPDLTVDKVFVPNGNPNPDAGDTVTFSITVANPGTVTGYAVDLTDPLPAALTGVSIVGVTGAGLSASDFSTAGNMLTLTNHLDLAGGQSFTVTFSATLGSGVNPGGTVTNVATLDFASAAGPGPVRTVVKTSDAALAINPDTIAKTIFTTSVGNDTSANVDVGEVVSFNLTATLAEGVSNGLTITDALPQGLTFVSGQVVAAGANLSGATLAPVVTTPGGVPTFAFGSVTDLADNLPQTAADQIVVRVVARVADVPSNVSHTVLTDVAAVNTVVNGTTITRTSALPVTVTVPDLVIAKAVSSGGTPDAGDTVTFTINVHHAADSTATAYDLALGDALPAGLTNLQVIGVNNDPSGTGTNGLALTPANFTTAGNTLGLATPLDLALNQSFTVTISGVVTDGTVVGSNILNVANLGYSTLPGGDPHGRGFTGTASTSFATAASQLFSKQIVTTDDPLTGTAQYRPGVTDLAIGETATVQLTTTLEQGTTPGVVIVDHLPINTGAAGTSGTFGFVGTPVLSLGPGITFTGSGVGVLSDTNGDGIPDTVTYTLGAVTVPGTPGPGTGTITVTYGTTPLDRPENQAGDALASPATLTSALGSLAASVDYDLVAPNLGVTKTVVPTLTPGGDGLNYTITLTNSGTGPAERIAVNDLLPPGVTELGPPLVSLDGGPSSPAAFDVLPSIPAGSHLTIDVFAGVTPAAVLNTTLTNTATATFASHDGPGGRPGSGMASASFFLPGTQALTKTIVSTDDPLTGTAQFRPTVTDLAIGETASVNLVATLQQGTTNNVVLTDHLPVDVGAAATSGTLGFVATPSLSLPAGATITGSSVPVLTDTNGDGIPDTITYNLGNVTIPAASGGVPGLIGTGSANVAIFYMAKVLDRPENVAGDALASPATLTSALGVLAANVDYDLVAPNVIVTKAVATTGTPAAGDAVDYTVTLTNTGSGPAEGLVFRDPGAPGVTLGTASVTAGGTMFTTTLPVGGVALPALLPGASDTITYTGIVADGAVTGASQVNTATLSYTSSINGGGRPDTSSASASFATAATQGFTKAIVATSVPSTGTAEFRPGVTDLVIGEQATVELVATLSAGTTNGVIITDHLPAAAPGDVSPAGTLSFAGAPTVTIGGVAVALRPDQIVETDTNGDGIPDTISFHLGTVTVPGGNPANDTVRIRYDVLAPDLAVNAAGDRLTSPATLTSSLGTLGASVDVDLVQPVLTIGATANVATVQTGGVVTYTVVVANPAGGSAQAEDVVVGDLLAGSQLSLVAGSVVTSQGTVSSGNGPSDTALGVQVGALPVGAAPVVITFEARAAAPAGTTLDTAASVMYDGIPGSIDGQPGRSAMAVADVPVGVIGFAKAITATSLPETGSAQFRPAAPDLAIGETATFTLTTTLPAGTTPVSLTDLLGDANGHLELVGTPTVSASAGVTVGPLTTTRPDLNHDGFPDLGFGLGQVTAPAGGGTVTITYTARVSDIPGNVAGGQLDLPATLAYGTGTATDSRGVDLVAPLVTLTKAATTVGPPNAGDVIGYTVTATNSGSGPAYDVTLADLLPTGVVAVPGSAQLTVGGATTAVTSPQSLTIPLIDADQTAVLHFSAVIGDSVITGSGLTNTATIAFDSLAGPGGRSGTAAASATVMAEAVQSLTKTIVATSEPFTGTAEFRPGVPDLTIGEAATVELRATLSEGTTDNVVLTDTLQVPGGTLTLTGTPVIVFGNGTAAPFTGTITTVDLNGDGIPDQVRFALGNVTIPGDNDPTNNTVSIRYQAVVADRPENHAGDALDLPATLTSALGTNMATAGVDLVAPALTVTKVLAPAQPADGQSTVFILTVGHAANSSAAATGVVLTDQLPAGSLLGSAVIVSGPAEASVVGGTVAIPILNIGDTLVERITVVPDLAHPATGDTINTAALAYGTTTGGGGRSGHGTASAVLPLANAGPIPFGPPYHDGPADDRRYVSPLLPIEPVYTGSAEPGSFVQVVVTDEFGSITGEGGALADAGGDWLIRLPSTSVDLLLRDSTLDDYYASTRLFSPPDASLFVARDMFGSLRPNGVIDVGSIPAFGTQIVHFNVVGSDAGVRTSYAPTWRDQVFIEEPGLNIERAFSDAAGRSIARLYDELLAPEAAGLNRFNRAFLSAADL